MKPCTCGKYGSKKVVCNKWLLVLSKYYCRRDKGER